MPIQTWLGRVPEAARYISIEAMQMIMVKLKEACMHRVPDGIVGMTFVVDSFTPAVPEQDKNGGHVAHIRDYRTKSVHQEYVIWSIPPRGYELINPQLIGTGDTQYSADDVEASRKGLIELRDSALTAAMFDWAVMLSHTIAQLAVMKQEIWGITK